MPMKQELASIELQYLVQEFQVLLNGKVDKIYQPEKDEFLFQFYLQGQGKRVLRMLSGKFIYLTKHKSESPQKPFGYCVYLRKYLNGARLLGISQVDFERIVKLVFETSREGKTKKYRLYVELFGKGNIILCDDHDVILSPLETQTWKDRVIRAKEIYTFPKRGADPRTITEADLISLLRSSDKDSLVKALALDLGLGGVYAEEACLLAGVNKEEKSASVASQDKQCKQLFAMITGLCNHQLTPCLVQQNEEVVDIVPFPLRRYQMFTSSPFPNYNEAMDGVLTEKIITTKKEERRKTESKAGGKFQAIIDAQSKQLGRMEKEAVEYQRAGELIYERYHLVEEVLREIKKAREKYSWKEIKEKVKGHKLVKDVQEKEGTITIEL